MGRHSSKTTRVSVLKLGFKSNKRLHYQPKQLIEFLNTFTIVSVVISSDDGCLILNLTHKLSTCT